MPNPRFLRDLKARCQCHSQAVWLAPAGQERKGSEDLLFGPSFGTNGLKWRQVKTKPLSELRGTSFFAQPSVPNRLDRAYSGAVPAATAMNPLNDISIGRGGPGSTKRSRSR